MGKLVFFVSVFFVSVSIIGLSGCKRNAKVVDNPITFDSLLLAETYYLNSDPEQPSCNLQVNFVYPKEYKDKKILGKMQILFIDKVFGKNYIDQTPEIALQNYKDSYIENFKQFERRTGESDFLENDEMKDETGFSYYKKLKNSIPFSKNNIISLLVESNIYEGGAHGSHSIYGYVFDLTQGSFIMEQHIFTENYKKPLSSIIRAKITKANDLKEPRELEEIGYGSIEDIVPNGNFIIDKEGITYYFNENEIASYFMGITTVFIPYREIMNYLRKDSPVGKLAGL
ncbi:MAG: DUF3298 and DUF4163 domain-containing protein [Dysgonamonadaceae bacterium]|jgi:hypothetical protein|nr:DUF3298 and DUF4163 domain-containing protein [Dysgonamonadaceae bacterium]